MRQKLNDLNRGSTVGETETKVRSTPQKSVINQQFLLKMRLNKSTRFMQETDRKRYLAVRLQSSMSEEHPPSPSKLMSNAADSMSGASSSLEGSKMITYRPQQSVGGSDSSRLGDNPHLGFHNVSGSSGQNADSKSSLSQLAPNLYRYVICTGGHQIETSDSRNIKSRISKVTKQLNVDDASNLNISKENSAFSNGSSQETDISKMLAQALGA